MNNTTYDIAIIGAGAVGSAIARELSRYELKIVLLEANSDVGMGTSKASTAIWHTGYDATPGSLEAALLKRSYPLMESYMPEAGIPFERIGGLLIAWNQDQWAILPKLIEKARQNGEMEVRLMSADEVYEREPHLGPGALGGMFVPAEGILCTFTVPLACATQAVVNGVALKLNFRVQSIKTEDDVHAISSETESVLSRWVINAAGLYSDEVNHHFGYENFKVTPRRGELLVYDKLARALVHHVLLPVPTAITKGVLISPTVYGNILLGPTAEDLPDKTATNTSEKGLQSLLEKGEKILPQLLEEEVTATYAGLRAATEHSDYQIALHIDQRYVCVGGIRSTGISASLGIAEYVAELLKEGGVKLKRKPDFKTIRMPNIGEAFTRPYQNQEMIAGNGDYGKIVCHCERVTQGELNDAIQSDIPAASVDALRRRTRAMQGRCQGFNCQASLNVILKKQGERRIFTTMRETLRSQRALTHAVPESLGQSDNMMTEVLIVGAGPAGLAAALELKKLGIKDVIVAEREAEAGGIPRMCGHIGFGLRDFHQVLTGPNYARKYVQMAEKAGIKIARNTTITGWNNAADNGARSSLGYTSPNGLGTIEAKSVLLATGVRERPRAARLVPGHRPQGVFTTGSLQRFVYEHHLPVGKRAVIVGAEIVSLSVVTTLLHAGVKVVNMVTELPRHQLYLPLFLPAKIFYVDLLARTPIVTNSRISNIFGRQHVEGIEITDLDSGKTETIECDTVIFTGNWIPENELARRGNVETGRPSFGPQVDSYFRTSQLGIFAAGNLLHGVETADWAALEGRRAAGSMARYLENAEWSASRLEIQPEAPVAWICPNVLSPDVRVEGFRFWSKEFKKNATLQLEQGARVLFEKKIGWLKANVALSLDNDWVEKVDFGNGPVKLVMQT